MPLVPPVIFIDGSSTSTDHKSLAIVELGLEASGVGGSRAERKLFRTKSMATRLVTGTHGGLSQGSESKCLGFSKPRIEAVQKFHRMMRTDRSS